MRVCRHLPRISAAALLCTLLAACRSLPPPADGLAVATRSVETNKDVVLRFIQAIQAKDPVAMSGVLTPDAHLSLVIAGVYSPDLHAFPQGTQWNRDALIRMEMDSQQELAGPLSLKVLSIIAEDDEVAAEVTGEGVRASTRQQYCQHYSYHIEMSRGQIKDIRLYEDTFEQWNVFDNEGPPARPPNAPSEPVKNAPVENTLTEPERHRAGRRLENIATNKAVVRAFLENCCVGSRNPDAALGAWAPDGVWSFAVGGEYSEETLTFVGAPRWAPKQLIAMQQNVFRSVKEPMTLDVYSLIGEHDMVSVEAVGILVRADGHAYRQKYSFHCTLWDGRLISCREYQDTLHQFDLRSHPDYAPVALPIHGTVTERRNAVGDR
jgi:ketosteroid isomerase-like protein